ncbi:hypothetical protein QCA50_011466 [Cerrena zonata]|uniref:Uncharacterized protein n=1 Tax=Cerrena zonata TaxID=2478898 RepID=A0AAW0G5N2_9APHY
MWRCIALKLYEERPVGVHMVLLYRARGLSFTGVLVASSVPDSRFMWLESRSWSTYTALRTVEKRAVFNNKRLPMGFHVDEALDKFQAIRQEHRLWCVERPKDSGTDLQNKFSSRKKES